jgi:DNA-binding transcriptional MocR family regulator
MNGRDDAGVAASRYPPMVNVEVRALADMLGPWASGADPMYAQLAASLRTLIERGDIPAGARIPSERELGAALHVSRTTVLGAYDQLRQSGLLRSRRGSGTRVAHGELSLATRRRPLDWRPDEDTLDGESFVFTPPRGMIELTIGAQPGGTLIAEEAERAAREDLPPLLRSFGYLPAGLPAFRESVAAHLRGLGVPTVAEQVLVTNGGQQAIDLIARHFTGPESTVLIESPTYVSALEAFRASGAAVVPVPLDDEGIRVDVVQHHAVRRPCHLVYANPTYQNPTGTLLGEGRGRELVRLADEHGFLVVDDMCTAYLGLDGARAAPLAVHDPGDRVLTVGSLSKVAWGGLRIGWIRAPARIVALLAARKAQTDFATSIVTQAIAVRLMDRLDELSAAARAGAGARLDALESALKSELPDWTWRRPRGGMCLWVRLPAADGMDFSRVAASHGVVVRAGPAFSADRGNREYLRVAYGNDPETLREAVSRLAGAWTAYRGTPRHEGAAYHVTV